MQRDPLTATHPHGYVLARRDRTLGLVRISKNASTESKVRLRCEDWLAFDAFDGPSVAFVREPYARFLSSMPETVLRMTHFAVSEASRDDRVVIPEDIHYELCLAAAAPIEEFASKFLELVEYSFFDAHHEPQVNFLVDREMRTRIDPRLYPTEHFERSLEQIAAWTGASIEPAGQRSNKGGAKAMAGRTRSIDLLRRISRTGVYRQVRHAGFLGLRYRNDAGPITMRELNELANRFSRELKGAGLGADYRERVLRRYPIDLALWNAVTEREGDVAFSEVRPG